MWNSTPNKRLIVGWHDCSRKIYLSFIFFLFNFWHQLDIPERKKVRWSERKIQSFFPSPSCCREIYNIGKCIWSRCIPGGFQSSLNYVDKPLCWCIQVDLNDCLIFALFTLYFLCVLLLEGLRPHIFWVSPPSRCFGQETIIWQ